VRYDQLFGKVLEKFQFYFVKRKNFKKLSNRRIINISIALSPVETDEKPDECIKLSLFQYTDINGKKRINPDVWQMTVKSESSIRTWWDYFNFDRKTKELIPDSEGINTKDVKLIDVYTTLYDETLLLKKIKLPNFIQKLVAEYFEKGGSQVKKIYRFNNPSFLHR